MRNINFIKLIRSPQSYYAAAICIFLSALAFLVIGNTQIAEYCGNTVFFLMVLGFTAEFFEKPA